MRPFLLFILTMACSPPTATISHSAGAPASDGAERPFTEADTDAIAESFLAWQGEVEPAWRDAELGLRTTFVDANGEVTATEFEVLTGSPAGFFIVEADPRAAPVSFWSVQGTSLSQSLVAAARGQGALPETEAAADVEYLWRSPVYFAVRLPDGTTIGLNPEQADADYGPEARVEDLDAAVRTYGEGILTERANARASLLESNFDAAIFSGEEAMVQDRYAPPGSGTIRSGASSFAQLYQINQWWDNDTAGIHNCYVGCSPLAFAVVEDYWDRNGYPKQIATSSDNSNGTISGGAYDSDFEWTLDELRYDMGTYCTSSGGDGSTLRTNGPLAINHFNSRGDGTWTSDQKSGTSAWLALQGEVTQWHPFVLHFDVSTGGHAAVGYKWYDTTGDSSDTISVVTGWSSPTSATYNKTSIGSYRVTRVMPP